MSAVPAAVGKRNFVPVPPTDWVAVAKCRTEDPELFFPSIGNPMSQLREVQKAAAVCRDCPGRSRCAAQALAVGERYGVWAGVNMEAHDARERRHKLGMLENIAAGGGRR